MARLIVTQGAVANGSPATIEVSEGELSIGRSRDNDLVLDEPSVSRHHAVIVRSTVGTVLRDLASANGTFINKRRITEEPLHDGDTILLGRAELRFEAPEEMPSATVRMDVDYEEEPASMAPPPPAMVPPPAPPTPQVPPPMAEPAAAGFAPPAAPAPPEAPAPAHSAPPPGIQTTREDMEYAGFWIRLLAYLIDVVIVSIAYCIILIPVGLAGRVLSRNAPGLGAMIMAVGYLIAGAFGIWYLLHFWARDGATPGKKLLHLKIVREDGVEPMGYGAAALRLLGYMASSFIFFIGFLMIAFTDRRRGLHDLIAKTVVIKTP